MRRIEKAFAALKEKGQTGFIAYITAGDPNLETTRALVPELARRGVDIVELGVPFSDPLADGPVNQAAAQRALEAGTRLSHILDMVADLRTETQVPIVLFTYFNPVHQYGLERLVDRAAEVGVDGILALDLPPEEAGEYKRLMDARGLDTIFLMTPTTREPRIRMIASHTTGFVYYVSRTGVTGEQVRVADTVGPMVDKIRAQTDLPIAVGFGVSRPEHAEQIAGYADAVVVGSAIVRRIEEAAGDPELVTRVGAFVETLVRPLRGA
ncbi:MAG: tryptophan synthase subunit alpha [bacterium]|nr:tryptophan synthase subunit alpha [bacterium]